MARAATLTDEQVRRARTAAQLLHRPGRRSVADLVSHLTGVQAQVLSAASLALRARRAGLAAAAVDRARVRDRSIVLCWAMRGTLHLITADDHAWLVPLVIERRIANAHRRLRQEGVGGDQPKKALRAIERMLDREGPLRRAEIEERLRRQGIRTEGQAIAHLVWLAAAEGTICYGPDRDGERCFVLVRDWLGGAATAMEPGSALHELVVRYLGAHAPAEPADLTTWSGIALADARRGWRDVEDRLVEVPTERGPRWALRSAIPPTPEEVVRLLPAFDEYLLGWKDRKLIAPASGWKMIQRGGGWLHPVVLLDGRAVGTWTSERTADGLRVDVSPFGPLAPALRRRIEEEARDIGRFLKAEVRTSYPKRSAR
ncbi:MAG: winged helix DNA-binding domain-containing protein [Actinobacteria bacterium]|nr:MAG: winged helix DNA-binding domain-containing protein [Actinomycetota bacterium]